MKLKYLSGTHAYYLDGKRCRGASSVAKVADDTYHLTRWQLRTALTGVAVQPHLLTAIAADHDDKAKMENLVDAAIAAGKGTTGRDYGTAVHRIIERLNTGDQLLETPEVVKLREQWNTLLEREGLQVVRTEGAIAHPALRIAGRFDADVVDLATGKTHVGDLKTGADADKYLHAHAVQLHLYASAPYLAKGIPLGDVDFETEEFEDRTGIDQDIGFVFHLPLEGEPSAIRINLRAGAECLDQVIKPIWAWRARKDLRIDAPAKPAKPRRIEAPTHPPTPSPSEGDAVDSVADIRTAYDALDEAGRTWVNAKRAEALAAGCDIHLSVKTERRAAIMTGLVALASAGAGDEALAIILEPYAPSVGHLNHLTAREFADACNRYVGQPVDIDREITPVDSVTRARCVDAVEQPHEANSLLCELADEVVRQRDEVDYLRSVADDLSHNMPQPTAEAPRW